jgi:hypothetical protein
MRRAECACGQLSAICEGEPVRVSVCHCLACKRRTGSAFSWNARWPLAAVTVQGRHTAYTRVGDEGGHCTHRFCPDCGVAVFYGIDQAPDLIAIPAGAFADATFPAPTVSVYDPFRRCAWVEIGGEGVERRG